MRHRPHLYVGGPWTDTVLHLDDAARRHLTRVLRYEPGSPVTYTDGRGALGEGTWTGSGVERGDERTVDPVGRDVHVLVAAPTSRDRQRFVVEKCQELGARSLTWLDTRWSSGRPVQAAKAEAWAVGALEQSRGTRLMEFGGRVGVASVTEGIVAEASGVPLTEAALDVGPVTVLVGPEGGFAPGEVAETLDRVALAETILRTDTAAVVAVAILRSMWSRDVSGGA